MSISDKELKQSYFVPKENKPIAENKQHVVAIYYTLLGLQDDMSDEGQPLLTLVDKEGALSNEGDCYAKMVNNIYFIKTISGQLFNPMGMNADTQKFKKQAGSYAMKWGRVSKKTFDNYLMFLRTKNEAYFLLAERAQHYG